MDVKVERKEPNPPPITRVVITLTEEEAKKLARFLGRLKSDRISEVIGSTNPVSIGEIYNLISALHYELFDKGLEW